jgi:hypothetical protein
MRQYQINKILDFCARFLMLPLGDWRPSAGAGDFFGVFAPFLRPKKAKKLYRN